MWFSAAYFVPQPTYTFSKSFLLGATNECAPGHRFEWITATAY